MNVRPLITYRRVPIETTLFQRNPLKHIDMGPHLKAKYFGRNYYGYQYAATWPINVLDVVLRHIPTTNATLVAIVIAVIVLKKQRTRERIVGY